MQKESGSDTFFERISGFVASHFGDVEVLEEVQLIWPPIQDAIQMSVEITS